MNNAATNNAAMNNAAMNNAAMNNAAMNNAAVSIHRLRSDPNLPVRAAADQIAWNPALGLRLLNS